MRMVRRDMKRINLLGTALPLVLASYVAYEIECYSTPLNVIYIILLYIYIYITLLYRFINVI